MKSKLLAAALTSLFAFQISADVVIEWAEVGDTGNPPDPRTGSIYGAVDHAFRIGKFEVSNTEYTEYLNTVDPTGANPNGIWIMAMGYTNRGGISFNPAAAVGAKYSVRPNMGNKPANGVSWYSAARFANWMHNGRRNGDTETGAYTLSGNTGIITRNPGARVWIPSESEWYKAAYYQPQASGGPAGAYWLYPTRSDSPPTAATATATSTGDINNPGPNVVNYRNGVFWNGEFGNVANIGGAGPESVGFYGTFDLGGNVQEWNDAVIFGNQRGLRGGYYASTSSGVASTGRVYGMPSEGGTNMGFRLATLPDLPPVADAGPPQSIPLGATVHLDGRGSTDDLTPQSLLACAWSLESAPVGSTAALGAADTLNPFLKPDRAGEYVIKLVVVDGGGLQDEDITTMTVAAIVAGGGFETGFNGWTATGNVEIQSNPPYAATEGGQLVSFNARDLPANGVLSQIVATIPGQIYHLEFDVGILAYNKNEQRLGVTVTGTNTLVSESIPISGSGGGIVRWISKSYQFTANSAATTLVFRDLSPVTKSIDLLLDKVRITSTVMTLFVASDPDLGINVSLTPPDTLGAGNGPTSFRRYYNPGMEIELTVPPEAGGRTFFNWLKNGAHHSTDSTTWIFMDGDHQMTAVYWGGEPMITVQPTDISAVEGGTAVFRVTASGGTPLSYQWRFNGDDVPGANDPELTIHPVGPDDAGTYQVIVSNSFGDLASAAAGLTIQSGFTGIENGGFETDFQGWTVSGNVWIQSKAPYVPAEGFKLAGFNAGNTTPNGVLSQAFTTTPGQEYILSFDMGVLAYNTHEQRLKVEVSGSPSLLSEIFPVTGPGGGKTRWLTQSLQFTADSIRTTLTFRDLSTTSNALDLLLDKVRIIPRIMRTLNVRATPLDGVYVEFSPPDESGSTFFWTDFIRSYAEGTEVALAVEETYITSTYPSKGLEYRFEKWLRDDVEAGNNSTVSFVVDGDSTWTAVFREAPPVITSQPVSTVAVLGGSAVFQVTCVPYGYAEFDSCQWRFNGIPIPGALRDLLVIEPVGPGDVGTYDVVVSNRSGESLVSDPVTLSIVTTSLVNGSFENGFDGWTVAGNVRTQLAPPYPAPNPAPDGLTILAFNSENSAPNGTVSQTFATVPGITYLLSFDMGVLAYNSNQQRMQADVNGNSLLATATHVMRGQSGGKTIWSAKTLSFTADAVVTKVNFTDRSTTTNAIDLLLDNIRIESAPEGFSLIPPGSFQMGDTFGEGDPGEAPVHTVQLSAFHMGKHEVTKALWDAVRGWAQGQGYTDLPEGEGKASNHPVHSVTWHDVVKWCNAYSEMDGLVPCYTESGTGTVMRSGVTDAVTCDFDANGYRIPTEAEWEKAARGGLIGNRFPTGDTISHSQANYFSRDFYAYDVSPTQGLHPDWDDGENPFTSVVGSFPANGYALHDMDGNLREWCWDFHGAYSASASTDPRGPSAGQFRMDRGGTYFDDAGNIRVTRRGGSTPSVTGPAFGFRLARTPYTAGFSWIPAGTFVMGSPVNEIGRSANEVPHAVTLTRSFWVKKTEVTWNEWNAVRQHAASYGYPDLGTGQNGTTGDASGTHPVTKLAWWDVLKWCNLRSEIEGRTPVYYTDPGFGSVLKSGMPTPYPDWSADGYRLPTEAEWEYGCRAGTTSAFFSGPCITPNGADPNLETVGWYDRNSANHTHPVARKLANDWGLWDMHGNVREWCWDVYAPFATGAQTDPRTNTGGTDRVRRGGYWEGIAGYCRSAARDGGTPELPMDFMGFRPARNGGPTEFIMTQGGD